MYNPIFKEGRNIQGDAVAAEPELYIFQKA